MVRVRVMVRVKVKVRVMVRVRVRVMGMGRVKVRVRVMGKGMVRVKVITTNGATKPQHQKGKMYNWKYIKSGRKNIKIALVFCEEDKELCRLSDVCEALQYEQIKIIESPIIFYFEK